MSEEMTSYLVIHVRQPNLTIGEKRACIMNVYGPFDTWRDAQIRSIQIERETDGWTEFDECWIEDLYFKK